jgi:hypothetical protein
LKQFEREISLFFQCKNFGKQWDKVKFLFEGCRIYFGTSFFYAQFVLKNLKIEALCATWNIIFVWICKI